VTIEEICKTSFKEVHSQISKLHLIVA